jgi:hypothetical protein
MIMTFKGLIVVPSLVQLVPQTAQLVPYRSQLVPNSSQTIISRYILKKEQFKKLLKVGFAKTGVKKLDTHSKEIFSYNDKKDFTVIFKRRVSLFASIFLATFFMQAVAIFFNETVPDPRYFITTYNGHVYEIPDPRGSINEAVYINKAIDGYKEVIKADIPEGL